MSIFTQLIDVLKTIPEGAFRVFNEEDRFAPWLPYLTFFYPVQIGEITPGNFAVKPVGDPLDILWQRYWEEEALIGAVQKAGGTFGFNRLEFSKPIERLEERGLISVIRNAEHTVVTLATPHDYLTANPEWNRAEEIIRGAAEPEARSRTTLKAYYDYTGAAKGYLFEQAAYEITRVRPSFQPNTLEVCYRLPNGSSGIGDFPEDTLVILKHELAPAPKPKPYPPVEQWNEIEGVPAQPLPPARPVAVNRNDMVLAVRRMFSGKDGIINQGALLEFLLVVMGDQTPERSPDPAPLVEALEAIKSGKTGNYDPAHIASQALYGYKTGAGH